MGIKVEVIEDGQEVVAPEVPPTVDYREARGWDVHPWQEEGPEVNASPVRPDSISTLHVRTSIYFSP
uniref:Uncharacterized protein n=1 Tax=Syphacia muris TaxID=451379 RepID=A0A0N5AF10_9BILA